MILATSSVGIIGVRDRRIFLPRAHKGLATLAQRSQIVVVGIQMDTGCPAPRSGPSVSYFDFTDGNLSSHARLESRIMVNDNENYIDNGTF